MKFSIWFVVVGVALILLLWQFGMPQAAYSTPQQCPTNSYSKTFTVDAGTDAAGDTIQEQIKLTAKATLCAPEALPAVLVEGDTIHLACTGNALYIGTMMTSCGEEGCAGTKVASTYDYEVKLGDTELRATCWAKKINSNYDLWVWAGQDIYYSFEVKGEDEPNIVSPMAQIYTKEWLYGKFQSYFKKEIERQTLLNAMQAWLDEGGQN